jgi:hypothetical protein
LRHDRTIEFGHPVHLRRADCSLRFEPVALNGDAVEVPFRYCADARFLQGALRLKTPAGPLALLITDRCDDEAVVGQGWILALHGYADLTCVPVIERAASAERTNRSTDGSRHRVSDSSRTVTSASRPRLGGGWALPSALEPVPATRALLATYVVGHRRRLSHGRRPSAEAREHAKPIGITLAANETWVKPHARGIPHDAELVFDWRA